MNCAPPRALGAMCTHSSQCISSHAECRTLSNNEVDGLGETGVCTSVLFSQKAGQSCWSSAQCEDELFCFIDKFSIAGSCRSSCPLSTACQGFSAIFGACLRSFDCTGTYPACSTGTPSGCAALARKIYDFCTAVSCDMESSDACAKECRLLGAEIRLKCTLTDRTACQSANAAEFQKKYDEILASLNVSINDAASPSNSPSPSALPLPSPASSGWWLWVAYVAGLVSSIFLALAVIVLACVLRRRQKARRRRLSTAVHNAPSRIPAVGSLRSSRYSSSMHEVADGVVEDGPSGLISPLHVTSRIGARAYAGCDVLRLAPPSRAGSRVSVLGRSRSGSASSSARSLVRTAGYDSPSAALAAHYDGCNATLTAQSSLGDFVRRGDVTVHRSLCVRDLDALSPVVAPA